MALLNEITEKRRALDAARPLPQGIVHKLADWFELELTVAGARVEQSGLTRAEIVHVLDKGAVLRNRPPNDQRLVLNHVDALRVVARLSYEPQGVVTERTITALHAVLYQGIDSGAGAYREGALEDGAAATPDPAKVRVSMSALSGWLRRTEPGPESAFEAHVRMAAVRPFYQGNAAVALLLTNLLLNRAGYPPVVVHAESVDVYRDTLERARTMGDKSPFRETMMGLLEQSLDVCLVAAAHGVVDRAAVDAGAADIGPDT